MRRPLLLWSMVGVVLALGIAFAVPASRYPILNFFSNERLYSGRPLHYWVAALKEDDPALRRRAAFALGDACKECRQENPACPLVLAALIEALADQDSFVRKCAATSLLMSPREAPVPQNASSIEHLTGAIADEEVAVRRAAVRSLWQARAAAQQADGVARLTAALGDKDDYVRAYAARSLGQIGPEAKAAVPTLLQHLRQDEERDIRKLSAKALGLIGAEAIAVRLPETVEALTQALKEEPSGLRAYAAR